MNVDLTAFVHERRSAALPRMGRIVFPDVMNLLTLYFRRISPDVSRRRRLGGIAIDSLWFSCTIPPGIGQLRLLLLP